jgi:hypothetical protein
MIYTFYEMNISSEKQIFDYSLKQLQQVSARRNESDSLSVKEETIHKILEKCGKFIRTIESDEVTMKELVVDYLNSTESEVNNNARAKGNSCYNLMRDRKEIFREKLSEIFLPTRSSTHMFKVLPI